MTLLSHSQPSGVVLLLLLGGLLIVSDGVVAALQHPEAQPHQTDVQNVSRNTNSRAKAFRTWRTQTFLLTGVHSIDCQFARLRGVFFVCQLLWEEVHLTEFWLGLHTYTCDPANTPPPAHRMSPSPHRH
eukprot:1140973-Pelagomonas_calceolata.AAC.6